LGIGMRVAISSRERASAGGRGLRNGFGVPIGEIIVGIGTTVSGALVAAGVGVASGTLVGGGLVIVAAGV